MSHLLIDRFRFDSFAHDSDEAGSNLLTRFGQEIYLTFIITPPESLVVRAWNRGLEVGRYKAVDDTLAHAIEAYAGMPRALLHVDRAHRQARARRIPRQQRAAGRASAHGRIRLERRIERSRRQVPARRRAFPAHRRRREDAGVALSRPGVARARGQHRVPARMRAAHSRGQFRRPGHGANLCEARVRQARFRRCRRARRRDGGFGNARRIAQRRARAVRLRRRPVATGRAIWPTPPCERARTRWGRGAAPDQMPANHWYP